VSFFASCTTNFFLLLAFDTNFFSTFLPQQPLKSFKMVRLSIATALIFAIAASAQLIPNNAGARGVGNGAGQQFTTGGCISDADCQEGCCAGGATSATGNAAGICSGIGAEFQNGKTGCGFNDPNAAQNIADAQNLVAEQGF
jgi:hypothetical protein